jgi:hypothetical protein
MHSYRHHSLKRLKGSGAHSGGETPVPIPNTEVKPASADDTGCASGRESRSVPGPFILLAPLRTVSQQYAGEAVDKQRYRYAPTEDKKCPTFWLHRFSSPLEAFAFSHFLLAKWMR